MNFKGILKTSGSIALSALAAIVLTLLLTSNALAQCGLPTKTVKPSSWQPQIGSPHVMRAALALFDDDRDNDSPSIVGMWHVVFTANEFNGGAIPDTVIDNAMVVVHSDGSEIMESARPPQDGNFCLGVWEQTGKFKYSVNHIPWLGNDTANAPGGIGNPTGGGQISEKLALSQDGKSYSGTFSLTAYNTDGTPAGVEFTGTLAATRVTVNTKITDLL